MEVSLVDCFHEGPNIPVVDPEESIDCTLCEPACPVNAIYAGDDLPREQAHFNQRNAELLRSWPVITEEGRPATAGAEPARRGRPARADRIGFSRRAGAVGRSGRCSRAGLALGERSP